MLQLWDPFYASQTKTQHWKPSVDVYEDPEGYHLWVEVPGMKPEDIKVQVENKLLTISGEKRLTTAEDKGYLRSERHFGQFSRAFSLSDEIDADNIEAQYDAGVLSLKLAKRAVSKPRQIEIRVSGHPPP